MKWISTVQWFAAHEISMWNHTTARALHDASGELHVNNLNMAFDLKYVELIVYILVYSKHLMAHGNIYIEQPSSENTRTRYNTSLSFSPR